MTPDPRADAPQRPRVAVVTNIIPDYRYPVFASLLERGEFDWRMILTLPLERSCEVARAHLPLQHSSTQHVWLSTRRANSGAVQSEPLPVPLRLYRDLLDWRPDAIIAGEWGLRSMICLAAARRLGIPLLIWSEDIVSSAVGRTSLQRMVRRVLAKRVDAVLGWGEPAAAYARSIGAAAQAVHCVPQAADNEFWTDAARTIDRDRERRRLGIQGRAFVFVGRLIQRKGAQNFIDAWSRLASDLHPHAMAIIVGTGEMEQQLRETVVANGLTNVVFAGFQGGMDLARYYAAADFLVLPSLEDVWGFAANEALCFGRPVLGSCFAGSTQGLVTPAGVGEAFDPTDIPEFSARLAAWIEQPPQVSVERCRAAVAGMTYAEVTRTVSEALRAALPGHGHRG